MPDAAQANPETGVASSIPDNILEAVAVNNVKTLGEATAHSIALAQQNAVAHQNRVNAIAEAAMSQAIKGLLETDPIEAIANSKMLTGNDTAQQIAQLSAAVSAMQASIKAGQTTPPVTAGGE